MLWSGHVDNLTVLVVRNAGIDAWCAWIISCHRTDIPYKTVHIISPYCEYFADYMLSFTEFVSIVRTWTFLYRSHCYEELYMLSMSLVAWASYQIRKFASCAFAGNAGNIFPATLGQRSRHASRHVHDARTVMHAGIANWRFPLMSVVGKTLPSFGANAQPVILCIW